MNSVLLALAQAQGQGQGQGQGQAAPACGGGMSSLILMVLMFAVFYLLLIRPQQKRAKQHQAMLGALKKGDEVLTRGGVIGKITGLSDTMVTLELQEKVRIRVLRSYVEGRYEGGSGKVAEPTPESK